MSQFVLVTFIILNFFVKASGQTLFNNTGTATHYIDKSTIFTFDGYPVAYLALKNNEMYNIYDFAGNHLAWYKNGLIIDHKGDLVSFVKGSVTNVQLLMEPIKGLQKIIPIKILPNSFEPQQPVYTNTFSINNIYSVIPDRISPAQMYQPSSVYGRTLIDESNFIPTPKFTPNFKALEEGAMAAQRNYDNNQLKIQSLLSDGYTYDKETDKYYSPQKWKWIQEKRKGDFGRLMYAFNYLNKNRGNDCPTNGKYIVQFFVPDTEYPVIHSANVNIKNCKVVSMDVLGYKRTFRNASKIEGWKCTATIHDNFGWTRDRVEYPSVEFYILDKE